jgi:hypothetical protein
VKGTNGCLNIGGLNVCGLDVGQSNDGHSRIVEHGDSGGSVTPDQGWSAGVQVGGIISAGDVGSFPGDGPGDVVWWTEISAACAQVAPYNCN